MKYKDFKQMSANEMKNVVGGFAPGDDPVAVCKTSSTACTYTTVGGGTYSGTCATIKGTGMTLDQCGCSVTNLGSQPSSDCNQY